MLVFGKGEEVPAGYIDVISMSQMGVELKDSVFVREIKVWAVDQLDISIRIDITIGWIKDILLFEEMSPDNNITGGQTVARSGSGWPCRTGRPSRTGWARGDDHNTTETLTWCTWLNIESDGGATVTAT